MATGRQTTADPAALIAALESAYCNLQEAHDSLRTALRVAFDHDDHWNLEGEQAAKVGYLASMCRAFAATLDRTFNDPLP